MVEDPAIKDVMWTESGSTFLVTSPIEFSKCLHNYFKHNNWQSFVRQLNMYQFHKVNDVFHATVGTPGATENIAWEFKHPSFQRGRVDLLANIKRKASRPLPQLRDTSTYTYTSQQQHREEAPYPHVLQPRAVVQPMHEPRNTELQRADQLIESLNHRIHSLEESQRLLMDQSSSVFSVLRTYHGILSGMANVLAAAIPDHNTTAIQCDLNTLSQQLTQQQFNPRRQNVQTSQTSQPMHIAIPPVLYTPLLNTPGLMSPSGWSNPGSPMPVATQNSPGQSPYFLTSAPSESSDSYFRQAHQRQPYNPTSQAIQHLKNQRGQPSPNSNNNNNNNPAILTPPMSEATNSPYEPSNDRFQNSDGRPTSQSRATGRTSAAGTTTVPASASVSKEDRCRSLQSLLNDSDLDHEDRKRRRAE